MPSAKKNPAACDGGAKVNNQYPDETSDKATGPDAQGAPRGYHDLVELSKRLRRPLCSLLGLSDDHDPFFCDRPGTRASCAEWFAELWQRLNIKHGVHLRRVHYLLVSMPGITLPNGAPYENTNAAWRLLGRAVSDARYQGLVDASAFIDKRADTAFEYHPRAGTAGSIGSYAISPESPRYSSDFNVWCDVTSATAETDGLGYFVPPSIYLTAPTCGDHVAIENGSRRAA